MGTNTMTYSIITLATTTHTGTGLNGPETRTDTEREPTGTVHREGNVCLVQGGGLHADDPAIAPILQRYRESFLPALWRKATDWQEQYISGVAIGLLTLGVAQGLPKALAVMKWNGDHWSEYYRRKEIILSTGAVDYDFKSSGDMPYSVPELREELGL